MYLLWLYETGELGPHTSTWTTCNLVYAHQELNFDMISRYCLPTRHVGHTVVEIFSEVARLPFASVRMY